MRACRNGFSAGTRGAGARAVLPLAVWLCACGASSDGGAAGGDGSVDSANTGPVDAAPGGSGGTPDAVSPMDVGPLDSTPVAPDAADSATPDAGAPTYPLNHPVDEACADDLRPGEAVVFAEGFARGAEGIAAGPDALYVSSPRAGEIRRVLPDGTSMPFVTLPDALGLAFLSDGRLAVADIGASNEPGLPDGGGLARGAGRHGDEDRQRTGQPQLRHGPPRRQPAGLGRLRHPRVARRPRWRGRARAGERPLTQRHGARPRTHAPVGGLHLHARRRAESVSARSRWLAGRGGGHGRRARGGAGITQDGVALDAFDQLYVARNVANTLARHAPDAPESPVLLKPEGLRTPASLVFGRAPGFDPCSLYVTELFGTRVWRVAVGAPGAPLP
jgi:gluconolactonase